MIMATRTGHIPPVGEKAFYGPCPALAALVSLLNEQRNSRESLQ